MNLATGERRFQDVLLLWQFCTLIVISDQILPCSRLFFSQPQTNCISTSYIYRFQCSMTYLTFFFHHPVFPIDVRRITYRIIVRTISHLLRRIRLFHFLLQVCKCTINFENIQVFGLQARYLLHKTFTGVKTVKINLDFNHPPIRGKIWLKCNPHRSGSTPLHQTLKDDWNLARWYFTKQVYRTH